MRVFWRVLVGLILTLTPAAYVAGVLVGPPQTAVPETPPTGAAQSPAAGVPHPATRRAMLVAHPSGSTADGPAPSPAAVFVSRPRPPVAPEPAPSAGVSAGVFVTDPVSPSPARPSSATASDQPSPQPPIDTATADPSGEGSPTAGDTWSPSVGPTDPARFGPGQGDGGW